MALVLIEEFLGWVDVVVGSFGKKLGKYRAFGPPTDIMVKSVEE